MKLHDAVELHGSKRAAARALGIPESTLRGRYKAERVDQPTPPANELDAAVIAAGFSLSDVTGAWLKGKTGTVQVKKKQSVNAELSEDFVTLLERHAHMWSVSRNMNQQIVCWLCQSTTCISANSPMMVRQAQITIRLLQQGCTETRSTTP